MTTKNELSAADVYEVRWVPTARLGPLSRMFHRVGSILVGQWAPGETHPVIFEKTTGKKATAVIGVGSFLFEQIQDDLERLSVVEFRNRYLGP